MNQANRQIKALSLFNAMGILILAKTGITTQKTVLSISSIPSGLYLLSVRMNSGEETLHRIEILK
ncbi:MAG: T9SS type A sorting domain-containing protein [Bacteroidia bacterium]|nr:T9SS type A sorting domain-containing protein [Bacteroidia bacterium]